MSFLPGDWDDNTGLNTEQQFRKAESQNTTTSKAGPPEMEHCVKLGTDEKTPRGVSRKFKECSKGEIMQTKSRKKEERGHEGM